MQSARMGRRHGGRRYRGRHRHSYAERHVPRVSLGIESCIEEIWIISEYPLERLTVGLKHLRSLQLTSRNWRTVAFIFTALWARVEPFYCAEFAGESTSHGCIRMSNRDDIRLHDLLPSPAGTEVKISTDKADIPAGGAILEPSHSRSFPFARRPAKFVLGFGMMFRIG